ncbi:hypothetical protein [Streptomyces sp. NPDC005407]|uniref:hypothetical protein n=1 Tax=Streptomyces sp. NPDC005407 TaxID=3155340 RepID=UPI0033A5C14A
MTAADKRRRDWPPVWWLFVSVWSGGHVIWDTTVWRRVVFAALLALVVAAASERTVRFVQKQRSEADITK